MNTADVYAEYANQVVALSKRWERLPTIIGLWEVPDFDALSSDALAHVDDCIRFLADPKHAGFQKVYAIWSMYKLSLDDYLAFVRKLLDLYNRDPRTGGLLIVALMPNPSIVPRNQIFDNYNKPEVQALLKDIAARPGWDQYQRGGLDWIITGGGFADFAIQVIAISKRSEGAVTLKGLWSSSDFDVLAVQAPAHIDDCFRFLADPNHTRIQKRFAIYSMYKLPLRDYLAFVRKILDLYDRGYATTDELLAAVAEKRLSVLPRSVIFDNYDDPEVQALLKDISVRHGWSQDERLILARVMEGGGFEYRFRKHRDAVMRYLGLQ
ncbi:MAG: hypothetical protein ACLPID_00985 [Beijerinckiaceae bacterium]